MAIDPQQTQSQPAADAAAGPGPQAMPRRLTPAAERALAEAAARRAERDKAGEAPPEDGGRDDPDPVRYGDWEVDGRAVDF